MSDYNLTTAGEQAWQLKHAINEMAMRYGQSSHRAGIAFANGRNEACGKTLAHWDRAIARQLSALMRLTAALHLAAGRTRHN